MKELITAVRDGRLDDIPALLTPLDRAERRLVLTELKVMRKEMRSWPWGERTRARKAVLVAGAGCHAGAAGCATWIGAREQREWVRSPYPWVLEVLVGRDPAWLADLARRLTARTVESEAEYQLVLELVRMAGCPLPVSDGLVRGWAERVAGSRWQQRPPRPLIDILRAEPHLGVLAPHLLDMPELPPPVTWAATQDPAEHWPTALTVLSAEGLLDRSTLLDRCVTRLVRGGKTVDMRFCLQVLRGLELTDREEAARVTDWAAMAADGPSPVAGHAQEALTRLDGHGELSIDRLADVSGSVLFRTEKKLVRSQLVLLGRVLRRVPSSAEELLPVVAEAFVHPDIGIQERALKLVARHLPATAPDVRKDLAGMASQLGAVHRSAARAVFGELLVDGPAVDAYEEVLPPVPVPRRLDPAPADTAELIEEVVALVRSRSREVTAFERALDGLIRCAHNARADLADALRAALAGQWWTEPGPQADIDRRFLRNHDGLQVVAASLLGRVSEKTVGDGRARWTTSDTCCHAALDGVLYARLWEAATVIRTGELPFLLATPTWHTGALDPTDLVERLLTYQKLGLTPGPADFGQALLRVRRTDGAEAAARAASLGTAEGDRLAAWIRADEPVAPVLRRHVETESPEPQGWFPRPARSTPRVLPATNGHPVIQQEFPRSFHWLGRPHSPRRQQCSHWGDTSPQWIATLPADGETLAAWLLPFLTCEEDQRGVAWPLPALAETDGPAEGAIHLALAYGLGARYPEDRLSAVDALLILAARGRLDANLLGGELSVLIDRELMKPSRLAAAARTAAATGAYQTVLSVLVPVLTALLAREQAPRGLSDLLGVAAECAEQCGSPQTGGIAGLAATAARGGSTQLVRQAARLEAACREAAG
ncbi:DUF6493 family protein [Streptomyces sp. NPDC087901]|uniref:DUF7824 domain-containing protein n=1 Tax=Streptomyces sp. NPDC087901 TaxID=3365818 RepID=UPI003801E749